MPAALQRLSQIRTELERQEAKRAAQGELAAAAAQGADSLDARLERVAQFQASFRQSAGGGGKCLAKVWPGFSKWGAS